ncbi:MAG: hypothetical protein ACOCX4_05685 [Planctomycetota bacterium]
MSSGPFQNGDWVEETWAIKREMEAHFSGATLLERIQALHAEAEGIWEHARQRQPATQTGAASETDA